MLTTLKREIAELVITTAKRKVEEEGLKITKFMTSEIEGGADNEEFGLKCLFTVKVVWLNENRFIGSLTIRSNKPVESLTVKASLTSEGDYLTETMIADFNAR